MSRLTALLLLGMISFQAFYNVGVLGYWAANRTYIRLSLCENRNRPQLHCDGKCYLKKKLATDSPVSGGGNILPALKKGLDCAECPDRAGSLLVNIIFTESAARLPESIDYYAVGFPQAVFHPPAQLS